MLDMLAVASTGALDTLSMNPVGAWDVVSFFTNGGNYVKKAGAALLIAMGTVAVVWGVVLLLKKLMSGRQDQTSWMNIVLMILVGGAVMLGGFTFASSLAKGGQDTINDLGGASMVFDYAQAFALTR